MEGKNVIDASKFTFIAQRVVFSTVLYLSLRTIYRLFFHPLRKFPGPKIAAISYGYQFYYDVVKGGRYIWEIDRMHSQYGPIVRINPQELHVKDSSFYSEIYSSRSRHRDKDKSFVASFGLPGATFGTVAAAHHQLRRGPLEKMFSKRAIYSAESLITENLAKFVGHLSRAYQTQQIVDIDAGFASLTTDIIHQYMFGYSEGHLDKENFDGQARAGINGLFKLCHLVYFFPVIQSIQDFTPTSVLRRLNRYAADYKTQKDDLFSKVMTAIKVGPYQDSLPHENIINTLLDSSLPSPEKSAVRLKDEFMSLNTAGTETTARALAVGIFHLYTNEDILVKLRDELLREMPPNESKWTWNQLEQLSFMTGVVKESLRLATGTIGRFSRVAPTESLHYGDSVIPPNTPVSQSNYFVLMDPSIFPNPNKFNPQRWGSGAAQDLDHYLVNFSKGSRVCLGMNLALAEMFLVLATVVTHFDLQLYKTSIENIAPARDFGVPYPENGNLSVRVVVTNLINRAQK